MSSRSSHAVAPLPREVVDITTPFDIMPLTWWDPLSVGNGGLGVGWYRRRGHRGSMEGAPRRRERGPIQATDGLRHSPGGRDH